MDGLQGQEYLDIGAGDGKIARLLYKDLKFAKNQSHDLLDVFDGCLVNLLVKVLVDEC